MHRKPELLAPIQDWKTLKFIKDLPDAIYFGVQGFNMREKANNFHISELEKLVEYCHSFSPPINCYLTTNILIYDSELNKLKKLISRAKSARVDALIVHDFAAIKYAKELKINFHISTQTNISNIESAKYYESLGAERLILARELSLDQIKEIKKKLLKETEIECFVHGSMCSAVSGRCYLSATICESSMESANRGRCVQPCRREWRVFDDQNHEFLYDGQLFLNAKDLCMIEHIPELINANIDAFKIEGRMKDPLYVKTAIECYKEAIDSFYENSYSQKKAEKWIKRLSNVYNRGFHTGFYYNRPTLEDIELTKRGNLSRFKKKFIGRVQNYHKNSKTMNISIEHPNVLLKKDDKLIITNKNFYHIESINNMLLNGVKIDVLSTAGKELPVTINVRSDVSVNFNDKVFMILTT